MCCTALPAGLRVRCGIASGVVPPGLPVAASAVMDMAKGMISSPGVGVDRSAVTDIAKGKISSPALDQQSRTLSGVG